MKERNTKQKAIILDTVRRSCIHPTAEQVYHLVLGMIPNISLGTVYRNLSKLAECGEIRRIAVPDAPDRFDKTLEEHSHVCCICCGAFEDACTPHTPTVDPKLCNGFRVERQETVFYGYCSKCQKE